MQNSVVVSRRYTLSIALSCVSVLALSVGSSDAQAEGKDVVSKRISRTDTHSTPSSASVAGSSEAITVTGSRGVQRTVLKSPTPIDIIKGTQLMQTGKASVISALNTLVPSYNSPQRAGGGTSTIIATGGLRGLNPDQMLVLVDGKRRHKTSLINAVSSLYNGSVPTDLDMIPASEIDHIEVLREGAAAQYGSDAIAGVINIILKKKPIVDLLRLRPVPTWTAETDNSISG